MAKLTIKINGYPKEAKNLVDIWNKYANGATSKAGISYITFINKRPKNPKSQNRRIAGIKAEAISYLRNDLELVKMSVENFIYLMAKCGVDIEAEDVTDKEV